MEHDVKIVIGANYGDEGKGLMSRYFAKNFLDEGKKPVTVFHNGSAQRGHTVDYEDGTRHVFHNFCAGAKDGAATYYANTFLVHPMDFCREARELGYVPTVICSPQCVVVTPFDMLADHIIEDFIAVKNGAREYGSCGYGTWSATDRIMERPDLAYTVFDVATGNYRGMMLSMMEWVKSRLKSFQVDLDLVPQWKEHLDVKAGRFSAACAHFRSDLDFFLKHIGLRGFDEIWNSSNAIIFEGAQGLLLDKDRDGIWTTTSNTGLQNPAKFLSSYNDYEAEVCYVSRAYVTRHGEGPLNNEVGPDEIDEDGKELTDQTNVFNDFQGKLRYALLSMPSVLHEVESDFKTFGRSELWKPTVALTHCNEYSINGGDYRSYSKTKVEAQ